MATIPEKKEKVKKIRRIVKLVLLSSFLKDEKPLSLIFIAPPEQSKTYFMLEQKTRYCYVCTDLSFMGLLNILREHKNLKHLIIPDFLKVTEKKASTASNLISLLNSFLEEGIFEVRLGNKEKLDFKGKSGGIITATTNYSFHQNKKAWEGMGFQSRFLTVSWKYSKETLEEIFKVINGENKSVNGKPRLLRSKKMKVLSTPELNSQLNGISNGSTRRLKNLQVLLKCVALENERDHVIKEDVEVIKDLSEFLNIKFNEI